MIPDIFEYSGVLSGCAVTQIDGTTVRINTGQFVTIHSGDYKIFTLDVARDITISGPDPSGSPIFIGLEINADGAITHFVEAQAPSAAQRAERCYLARVVSWGTGLAVKPHYNNLRQAVLQLKMLHPITTTIRLELMEGTANIKRLEGKIKGPDIKNVPDTEDKYNTYEISLPELMPANLILRAVDGTNALGTTSFPFPPKTCAIGGTPIDYTGDNWGFFHASMGLDGSVHLEYPGTTIAGTVGQIPSDNYVSRLQREGFVGIIAVHGTALSFGAATAFYGNDGYLEVESPKVEGEILATVMEDGKPMWRRAAAPSSTSPVKDAIVGQLAQYDTTSTVIGTSGLLVPPVSAATADMVLSNDGQSPEWIPAPSGGGESNPSWTQITLPEPSLGHRWMHGIETIGGSNHDHFYLLEETATAATHSAASTFKVWRCDALDSSAVPVKVYETAGAYISHSYAKVFSAQYYYGQYLVVATSQANAKVKIEVIEIATYTVIYTHPLPAEVAANTVYGIMIEILQNGGFMIGYTLSTSNNIHYIQYVSWDGATGFTPSLYHLLPGQGSAGGAVATFHQEGDSNIICIIRGATYSTGQLYYNVYTLDILTPEIPPVPVFSDANYGNGPTSWVVHPLFFDPATKQAICPGVIQGGFTYIAGYTNDPTTGGVSNISWGGWSLAATAWTGCAGIAGFNRANPKEVIMVTVPAASPYYLQVHYGTTGGHPNDATWTRVFVNIAYVAARGAQRPWISPKIVCVTGYMASTGTLAPCHIMWQGLPVGSSGKLMKGGPASE